MLQCAASISCLYSSRSGQGITIQVRKPLPRSHFVDVARVVLQYLTVQQAGGSTVPSSNSVGILIDYEGLINVVNVRFKGLNVGEWRSVHPW